MKHPRLLVCGLVAVAGAVAPAAAASADTAGQACGDVSCTAPATPAQPQAGPTVSDPGSTASVVATGHAGLAFTGGDIAGMTILAFGATALGSALLVSSRRGRRSAAV